MKKLFFTGIISTLLLVGFSGCYKTCEDPFAVNYTQEGACVDLTAGITGNYNGQLMDSIVGLHSDTSSVSIQISRVDDSHVNIVSAKTSSFVPYQAAVSAVSNGYYLTIASQTSNGLTVVGAGVYFSNPADGVYVTAGKQLTIYSLAGTQYQGFIGTQQ